MEKILVDVFGQREACGQVHLQGHSLCIVSALVPNSHQKHLHRDREAVHDHRKQENCGLKSRALVTGHAKSSQVQESRSKVRYPF